MFAYCLRILQFVFVSCRLDCAARSRIPVRTGANSTTGLNNVRAGSRNNWRRIGQSYRKTFLYFPSVDSSHHYRSWSRETIIQPVVELAPVLTGYSTSCSTVQVGKRQKQIEGSSNSKQTFLNNTDICWMNPSVCNLVVLQLAWQHSNHSIKFAAPFGLFLWSTGTQRKMIDTLFCCRPIHFLRLQYLSFWRTLQIIVSPKRVTLHVCLTCLATTTSISVHQYSLNSAVRLPPIRSNLEHLWWCTRSQAFPMFQLTRHRWSLKANYWTLEMLQGPLPWWYMYLRFSGHRHPARLFCSYCQSPVGILLNFW